MGFDINVTMEMFLCPHTGKPFYYGTSKETKKVEKIYALPDIVVPGKMCDYIVGRGPIFHVYTEYFNDKEIYNVSINEFLEHFPSWEEVVESAFYNDEDHWIEEDHLGFHQTLEWCSNQDLPFRVCWSY